MAAPNTSKEEKTQLRKPAFVTTREDLKEHGSRIESQQEVYAKKKSGFEFSRASHPAARSNTLEKTKENIVLVVALPRTTSTLSGCCQPQNFSSFYQAHYLGDIGLVVDLPKTYCLSVTSTLLHCCQLQGLSSCCQVQYLVQNKGKRCVGGGPIKNLFQIKRTIL